LQPQPPKTSYLLMIQKVELIQGKIITTDDQPAAYVSVGLKEINRFTITDEKGHLQHQEY
jgi:hypothetical protein